MEKTNYDKVCSCCGKEFSLFFYDYRNYVYKIKKGDGEYVYQCSYPCWIKERQSGKYKRYRCVTGSKKSSKV